MFKPVDPNPNFPEMEKKWLKHWYESGIVHKYLHKNDTSDKFFSFQDGPITANNPMGVHHAWGRSYKDLWQRFYNLLGYRQRFQNGFDCQGLWVEVEVEKELGLRSKKDIENIVAGDKRGSIAKFVQLCKDRVMKFAGIQTEQTKRLGNFMDWDHSYFTMSDENNYMIWRFLKRCFENGWIYKGRDSVPWCPRCETAISQHEMLTEDYKDAVHESIYFKLKIEDRGSKVEKKEYLLVWTTTPWTLPANIAVAVEESFDYSLVEVNSGEQYWIAKDLIETVLAGDYKKIVKTVKGKELVGLKYKAAFDDLPAVKKIASENPDTFHTVVATDERIMPITLTEGTGLVHTAVSAGTSDFQLGKKMGLPLIPVIADDASYLDGFDFLSGKNAKKHPELILAYMRQEGWAYKTHQYKHRYPACWRCKAELVWKVADEWYIAMDVAARSTLGVEDQSGKTSGVKNKGKTFRKMMIEVVKKITWMPEFGLDRELDWLKNMHDWLISKKNRYWGLALPIYECKKCGRFEVLGSKDELKTRAVAGWDEFEGRSPHKPYIDEVKIKCTSCGEVVERIDDVGNPWLDAGIVPYSTIAQNNQGEPLYTKNRSEWEKWFPVDFITESFPGQFKNWFYALIAMSTALENKPPFKTVLGFATLLGEDGRPMHKSWGNSIEFNEGADKIGVDVMRWMYARQNPADNMLFGYKRADEVRRQFYLMLYNVYKFYVEYALLDKSASISHSDKSRQGQVHLKSTSWTSREESETGHSMTHVLDLWIIARLHWLTMFVKDNLKRYNAKDTASAVEEFVSDISTWYIRRSRDRVWVNSDDTDDKKSLYKTLHYCLVQLTIILSPIVPFLSEEIYTNLTGGESVHLSSWPSRKSADHDHGLIQDMGVVREIVEAGHKTRKEHQIKVRQILKSVHLTVPRAKQFTHTKRVNAYHSLIQAELNVQSVTLVYEDVPEITATYDTNLTDELKKEGELREMIRAVQQERKKLGLRPDEEIHLTLPDYPKAVEDIIMKKVLAKSIKKGEELRIDTA